MFLRALFRRNHTQLLRPHITYGLNHFDDSIDVAYLGIATMILDLQKDLEHHDTYDMITRLNEMPDHKTRNERFETVKSLHDYRMEEFVSVSTH